MAIQMSEDQLSRLLTTLHGSATTAQHPQAQGSFARCTARYNGRRDRTKLEEFINTTSIYKEIEGISEVNAIRGLPLLLEGEAAIWWQGVKDGVRSWTEATELLQEAFAPRRLAHVIYADIFGTRQDAREATDTFLARKRALLAELPHIHAESMQIDMVYSLLKLGIREKIPRDSVRTFEELIRRARTLESLEQEVAEARKEPDHSRTNDRKGRCAYCRKQGHTKEVCRKRQADLSNSNKPNGLKCYGCGAAGYVKSNCPHCNVAAATNINSAEFYAVSNGRIRNRPTVSLSIEGYHGYAAFDTGAKTSIASSSLYKKLQSAGTQFEPRRMQISLADGRPRVQTTLTATLRIQLANREFRTPFIILPEAEDNKTLLGIDFLEDAGIVINTPQRCWNFVDQPQQTHAFHEEPTAVLTPGKRSTEEPPSHATKRTPQRTPTETIGTHAFAFDNPSIFDEPPRALSPLSRTPRRTPQTDELIDELFERCFSHESIELATLDIAFRPEEASELSWTERSRLETLLETNRDLFEENGKATTYAEHRIHTGEHPPVAVPPYRLSPSRKALLQEELGKMLTDNIIEECESPWAAPVVLVPKKDGGIRVCIDYRRLNAVTVTDAYPMPRIDDLLHSAKGTRLMSSLDLRSGYWQIPVAPEDQDKTAFTTPFGTFRFKRMPFGLKNAPATFQRMMDRFRTGLGDRQVIVYLDDLLVLSSTFDQHVADLEATFNRLRTFDLRMKREKCHFGCTKIKYLGHILTTNGIAPDPEKTMAITARTAPRNLKELLSFVQVCSWYRRFVPNFAAVAEPLTRLTKKKASWQWGEEQEGAFRELKKRLTEAPILQPADETKPYLLKTDASSYALGGVLLQGEKSEEHPVEYASRLLSAAERNYSTTEREALAVVWSIDKFRGYIEGAEVTVISDHQPLRWLMSLKSPSGRLARWALMLQSYNLRIEYAPGRTNVLADFLSRPPIHEDTQGTAEVNIGLTTVDFPTRSSTELREGQLKDNSLRAIIQCFEESQQNEDFLRWTHKGYILSNGVLYRYAPDTDSEEAQLVVPEHERQRILEEYHDAPTAGHYGAERTIQRINTRYYWPGMRKDISRYVRNCVACQRYKASNLKPAGLLQTPAMQQRFATLSIDLFGPLTPSTQDRRWILIVEDTASRWVELFPLERATADECTNTLVNEVLLRYGIPRRLICDNGTQFISAVMQQTLQCLGIEMCYTPVYHPQANPVERKNRDLKAQLAILVRDKHATWEEKLPAIRFAMNTARCSSTGYTPAYLTFGRELPTPDDVTRDLRAVTNSGNFVPEVAPRLLQLAETLKKARETHEVQQSNRKEHQDKHRRPDPGYQPGDLVWVDTHVLSRASKGVSAKLAPRRDGPYVILQRVGPTSYEIASRTSPTTPLGKYHTSALTPYQGPGEAAIPQPIAPIRRRGRPRKTA